MSTHSLTDLLYRVTIILLDGESHTVSFRRHAYNNLMELIVNDLYENIGDCKGHAWCGTCHVELTVGELREDMTRDETMTLEKLSNTVSSSRLACQIMTDERINGMTFRVLGDV